jgi:hypothetical protein
VAIAAARAATVAARAARGARGARAARAVTAVAVVRARLAVSAAAPGVLPVAGDVAGRAETRPGWANRCEYAILDGLDISVLEMGLSGPFFFTVPGF